MSRRQQLVSMRADAGSSSDSSIGEGGQLHRQQCRASRRAAAGRLTPPAADSAAPGASDASPKEELPSQLPSAADAAESQAQLYAAFVQGWRSCLAAMRGQQEALLSQQEALLSFLPALAHPQPPPRPLAADPPPTLPAPPPSAPANEPPASTQPVVFGGVRSMPNGEGCALAPPAAPRRMSRSLDRFTDRRLGAASADQTPLPQHPRRPRPSQRPSHSSRAQLGAEASSAIPLSSAPSEGDGYDSLRSSLRSSDSESILSATRTTHAELGGALLSEAREGASHSHGHSHACTQSFPPGLLFARNRQAKQASLVLGEASESELNRRGAYATMFLAR